MQYPEIQKIFIVDADPFWTGVLLGALAKLGYYDITAFNSGADCIEHLSEEPGLVFMDSQVEALCGRDVLYRIERHHPSIPVIFCSAQEDIPVAVKSMKGRSCHYISKTRIHKGELVSVIDSAMRRQAFSQEIY